MVDPFEEYRQELLRRDLAPSTRDRYWQVIASYRRWLGDRGPSVNSAEEFIAHLRDMGYRPRSVLLYYHALRPFLDFLGLSLRLKIRKPKTLPGYYYRADIERLIAQAEQGLYHQTGKQKERNRSLIVTLAYTGIRRSELLALRVSDVDFERRTIFIGQGKGQKDRVIPMAERLVAPLRSQCEGKSMQARVFAISVKTLYRIVRGLAEACGLHGFHPHSLRHYFATALVERGASLRDVQTLLGHSSLDTTALYIDVSAAHLAETISLLDKPQLSGAPQTTHSQ